jgi:transcriptional regulator with XRE-family HTH domain
MQEKMSFFGRNIKKIRAAKNISQSAFADLFGLTRASIGAYEEGRAEAKIDTIIEISNYFNLSLDQILKKELTINDIYHIGEKSKSLEAVSKTNHSEIEIPLVNSENLLEFVKEYNNPVFINSLFKLKLPGLMTNSMAFEFIDSLEPRLNLGLRKGDLLIGQRIIHNKIDYFVKNQLFIALTNNELFLSKLDKNLSGKLVFEEKLIPVADNSIKAIWTIYHVISNKVPVSDQVEIRLQNIESQLNKLLNK